MVFWLFLARARERAIDSVQWEMCRGYSRYHRRLKTRSRLGLRDGQSIWHRKDLRGICGLRGICDLRGLQRVERRREHGRNGSFLRIDPADHGGKRFHLRSNMALVEESAAPSLLISQTNLARRRFTMPNVNAFSTSAPF